MKKEVVQKRLALLILRGILLLFPFSFFGQNFSVQANPTVIPPYSLKLSEYGTGMSEKLILNLLLTDVSEFNLQVRLKLYIENNEGISVQSTQTVIGASPIFLDGGTPLRLTNVDLKPYFSLQNLRGITPQQYNKPFPEGLYRFCFEVYEAFSDRLISRKSCAIAYLVLNDPPFLNLPNRGEQITIKEPQNIIFQWTPRHLNATNVEYEFTLTEIWDRQMNPQAAFLASRPLYQTNTFANTLLYGPAEPALLPDKLYAWRVRAMVSDGISETAVFKNDGYSEIYNFTYADNCKEPAYVLAEAKSPVSEKILWQGDGHIKYNVQYRNKTAENSVWFDTGTVNESASISNLEPGTTYEFRVGGQCLENGPLTYSQIYEFTTSIAGDDTATYNCGITPEIIITNQKPLEVLVINEVFTAGDFPVTVKEVIAGNGEGVFSGWGYIVVPYLENTKIKVSFNGIKINTDYQLTQGIVETDYDENWGGVDDISNEIDALVDIPSSTLELVETIIEEIDELVSSGQWKDYSEKLEENMEGNLPQELDQNLSQAEQNLDTAVTELEVAKNEGNEEAIEQAEEKVTSAKDTYKETMTEVKEFIKEASKIIKKALKEIENENSDKKIEEYQSLLEITSQLVNVVDSSTEIEVLDGDVVDTVEIEMIGEKEPLESVTSIPKEAKEQITKYYNNEILYNRAIVSRYFSNSYSTEEEQQALAEKLQTSGKKLGNFILEMKKEKKPEDEIIKTVKEILYEDISIIVTNKIYKNEDQ